MVLFLKFTSGCRLFVRVYASLEISSALLRQPRYDVVSEDFVLRREVGQDWRCTDLSTDERYLAHSIHGTHTMTNSLHFHQAFVFTRRCGGREVVRISGRAEAVQSPRTGLPDGRGRSYLEPRGHPAPQYGCEWRCAGKCTIIAVLPAEHAPRASE